MAVQINVAANQAALVASIQAGVQAYNQRFANNNQINLNINSRAFSQPLGRITGDVKDFEAALAASNARVIAFGASTAVLGGVIRSFKELAAVTIDVEKNLADINRVFGLTTSQLQKFSTDLFNVSKQTASSFDDASKAALEFSRQGLKAEDTLQRTKDALTLTRLAGISTANAVDALTSTVNGFAATGISTTQILNKLVAVEQDYAVGAGDLAEALSRTGQAAQEAGVSLDQLNALVTAAQQSTARGGAVIGNALKTIFTRLQRTETLDQLEAFNIAVRDVQGNILPAVTILQNFAGAYKNLADAQKAQLSEQVAGVYQVNILKAVVNDLNNAQGVYAGALQRGASATNEAEVATAKLNRTLDALLSQTATSAQQLANNIGKVTFEPLARYGTEQLKSLVESMNEILEGEGIGSTFANGLLKGIRNILAGPGAIAAFFTLFKLIQNSFTYLSQALPQIAGITTETQNRKNIEQSILQIMQQQGPLSQALAGTMGNQAAQAQLLLQLARQQTAEYQQQSALAKQLAVQLSGQGVKVAGARGLQVTRAGGYVPPATRMAEVVGAQAGGYSPGKVVASPVGGVMNTAEDVKYIPGFAQPFINPPANSKAGRAHRQNAINKTGVDPYMASGFLPNFSDPKDVIKKSFTGKLNSLKITSNTEKEEIQEVADLEIVKGIGKNAEIINDNIVGTGIRYDVQKYQGSKTNEKYREEAAKLALSGKIDKITKAMPNNKKSLFNGKQWQDNLQTLKDNKIDLTNTALLSNLKLQVPSLSTGKMIDFGKQYTGLLNALSGEAFERDIAKKESDFIRSGKGNARLDFIDISKNQAFLGGEAKLGNVTLGNLVAKAIESTGRTYDNGDPDKINFSKPIKLFVPAEHKLLNKGFIPNFAPPTSAMRIPWFKKFANPAYDNIQPTLGISKASDVDTFRTPQFRSKAFEKAATNGDPNIFGPLYEDFATKALQLVNQSNIFGELFKGKVLTPGVVKDQDPFDRVFKLLNDEKIGIDMKGFGKNNLSGGSIAKHMTDKYNRVLKTDPEQAAKIKEAIMIFNEPGHENQLPSEFGKNFIQLAGTSYSQMLKNSPTLVKELSNETNMLLDRYVKNPQFLKMNAAGGFIPNFGNLDVGARSMLINSGTIPFVIDLERQRIAESSAADDMFHSQIVNKKFIDPKTKKPIYPKLYKDDIHSAFWKDTFVRGFVNTSTGKVDFDLTAPQKEDKNFMQKYSIFLEQVRNKYAKKFEEAINKAKQTPPINPKNPPPSQKLRNQLGPYPVNHFNNGFIPNFADPKYILETLKRIREGSSGFSPREQEKFLAKFGAENTEKKNIFSKKNILSTGKFMGMTLPASVLKYIEGKTPQQLNAYPPGYLDGVFNVTMPKKYEFTNNKGFIPNFNFIKGRNSFQKNWLIETAKKRNLNLNDPNVFHQLATEFAKTYPNNQGMFGLSKGFIPNFAYKQSVMGLEESMSGNKAIFDTKPFPHIRNSSQPTFSSAIADHGGLGNALSDSMRGQKAAGLMSRGFIPNFVAKRGPRVGALSLESNDPSILASGSPLLPSGMRNSLIRSVNDLIKQYAAGTIDQTKLNDGVKALGATYQLTQQSQEKLQKSVDKQTANINNTVNKTGKFAEGLSKASTAISIAGPMIAGLVEQSVFGNRKRTEMTSGERAGQSILSTGLSAVSTGAGIGAAFGPLGAGIGAAAGALVALTSALNATTLSAEELAQLNQEQVQKSQASISAASSYIEAQKSLTQMIASGASSSDIEIATKKLSDNFNEIKDVKLQEIFNATGGDVALMTKQLQDYTDQVTKESARKTGLYGADLKPEERASALSLGLGKEGSKDFVSKVRQGLENIEQQRQKTLKFQRVGFGGMPVPLAALAELTQKEETAKLAESLVPKNEPQRESSVKALTENLLNKNFEEVLKALEKTNITSEANKAAVNFKQAATRSFNQIFLDMEQQIAKSAFDVALSFEKDSGSRRIQSAILDFSTNFQDSINSFLSNNLPDARKFDFTAATAGQKAELQLQKIQQDYNKALAEQENDKSNFLIKNAENLTKEFKSSFLPSQAAAEFYQSNVLPQIQQGTFTGNAASLAQQFTATSFQKAKTEVSKAGLGDALTSENISTTLGEITVAMTDLADKSKTNTEEYKQLQEAQKALIDLQNQTALFQNKNEMTKLQGVIDTAMREKEIFEAKQENAKKELAINKQLSEARIAVEKDIAVEKAAVDKANLMRMEKMKDLSANIGNSLEISKARSAATVNAMQRRLEDQRETYGMSRTQISERKFGIQADILKEQRKAEDAAINAEIQQRVLEMAAEQENTAATLKLNDTIMTLIETQLRGALGGSVKIEEINAMRMAGVSPESIDNALGKNTYAQYEALQRIQESRAASAANNTGYNTSTFESNIQSKGFNDRMTQAEQLTFLEKEETAARNAGNLVLAGTIKRYQDQIKTKQQALQITRDDIDAQVRLNTEVERTNNTFAGRFKKGWGSLTSEADDLVLNLGENLPKMFADGLVDGIKAAIRESNNLGEALMGIASKFLDSISSTLMQSAVYGILGSIGVPNLPVGKKQHGGIIRAQSGMYISGTGSGDKYPAMLENGEYVLNRKAVMAMGGPAALDTLNFSAAPRFAAGGSFGNNFDNISSMESNMTTYGLEQSQLYNELRDSERQKQQEAIRKRQQRKAERNAMIGSIIAAVATAAIAAGVSNVASNVKATNAQKLSAKVQATGGAGMTNSEMGKLASYQKSGLLGKNFEYIGGTPQTGFASIFSGPTIGKTWYQKAGASISKPFGRRQTGGYIGSRLSDTIPTYATGGLVENPIVKRYAGGGNVGGQRINNGAGNTSTVNNNTNATNSFNFNTTVQRDGKIEVGANTTSYAQQDVQLSQSLNSRVYEVVLDTIRKEKRFGGSLAGVRNT